MQKFFSVIVWPRSGRNNPNSLKAVCPLRARAGALVANCFAVGRTGCAAYPIPKLNT